MNPMKRKNEEADDSCDSKPEEKITKTESADDPSANLAIAECVNETDPQTKTEKADNGEATDQPSTSEDKTSENSTNEVVKENEDLNESDNQVSEQSDVKRIKLESSSDGSGTLLFCGGTNWDLIGRRELPKNAKDAVGDNLWGPHRLSAMKGIKVTAVFSGSVAVHSVIITEGGKALSWGRNDKGQLGHCDNLRRDIPTLVETLKEHNIVSAACGRSHTLFLSDRGMVYSTGDNKLGQCGIGSQDNAINIPTKLRYKGSCVTAVACGAEFSIIVDTKGGCHSFGCPEYGQLGHNSDGQYFVTSRKLAFRCEKSPRRIIAFTERTREGHVNLVDDVHIVDIACGINHTIAVDSRKRCFSWGFGGYGRLGHAEQKDEMVPRLVKAFDGLNRGVKKVYAGGTYSMAINEFDVLYFWGQHKRAGEANMYPKPVPDLVGWKVRDVGCCNSSIVCIADESVIAWGPSPTYGELGYGDMKKSSTTPQEVKPLEGIHINSVSCGYGHTLFIARSDTPEEEERISQLPEHTP